MWQYRIWILVLIVTIPGCATRSPDPCQANDWYAIGYEDGRAGRAAGPVSGPEHGCPAGLAEPELARYRLGREAGLSVYCEPQQGFQLGMEGDSYTGGCRAPVEAAFLHAYNHGKRIYDVETQIRRLESILAVNESERDRLDQSIQQLRTELAQTRLDVTAPEVLRAELRELEATAAMVEAEIDALRAALREQHTQLGLLRQGAAPGNSAAVK
jgi:prefoldin subunit 5